MLQNILVADEPIIAMDIEDVLEALDYRVAACAHSVSQALDEIGRTPVNAAIVADRIGDEWSYIVADELARRAIPFLFTSFTGSEILPSRFRHRPVIDKPFELPSLVVAVARLTGLLEPPPALCLPSSLRHVCCDADLDDVENHIAAAKARVARIEALIWHRPTRDGKRLLVELRKFLAAMTQHRDRILRALGRRQ